jgi:predicted ATP-grasp superfamily ATP-dependent carboligase
MLIFVYEYTCAADLAGSPMSSLRKEGWAMLSALVEDFSCIPGVEVRALLNRDVGVENPGPEYVWMDVDEESVFLSLARRADYTLVIAPELDNILAERCQWVEGAGGRLLGSSADGVRLTADKYTLGRHWIQSKVPTPECSLVSKISEIFEISKKCPHIRFPLVLKPRFGAGSLSTFLIRNQEELAIAVVTVASSVEACQEWIAQSFVTGLPASVAFLIGPNQGFALPPANQILSDDGRFHYLGGEVPLPEHLTNRACRLASRAIGCVPGLRAYVGVDLVLGSSPDGSEDWAIEINPRLTTSYIGLRALAEFNLAEALFRIANGQEVQPMSWRTGKKQFRSDGHLSSVLR